MSMPNNAKALVAAFLTAVGPTAAAAIPSGSGVGTASTIESLVGAVVSYLSVYWTTNGKSPKAVVADAMQGITVLAQVDGPAFLAYLQSRLPDLLSGAVQAALKGSSAPAVTTVVNHYTTAPAEAPAASPDILGKADVMEPPAASDMIGGTPSAPVTGTGV